MRPVNCPVVWRTEWGAHDPRYWKSMKSPGRTVRFTGTGTGPCPDRQAGVRMVKLLQEAYMDSGFWDIPHSCQMIDRVDLGNGRSLEWVRRMGWQASRPSDITPLHRPATVVRLSATGGPKYYTVDENAHNVALLEQFHVISGIPDIPYNFLVGGDGMVYEGRGYILQPFLPPQYAHLNKTCINIALMGNFDQEEPSYLMMRSVLDIIRSCIFTNVLSPKFEYIPLENTGENKDEKVHDENNDASEEQPSNVTQVSS